MQIRRVLTAVGILLALHSQAQDIVSASFFQGSYQDLLQEAKRLKKPILLDFTASWCAPCKKMYKETFSDEEVASMISVKYLAYKVDVESYEGMEISDALQVAQYPTIVFLDSNANAMNRVKGFFPPDYFLRILEKNSNRKLKRGQREEESQESFLSSL